MEAGQKKREAKSNLLKQNELTEELMKTRDEEEFSFFCLKS